jgi:ABC-type transport system involved in multi-copper enzyme maturation permease subunit
MTTTIDPHQSTPSQIGAAATAPTASPTPRVTFPRLVSSEWLKFRTLRSNAVALGGGAAAAVGFGALFSYLADSGDGPSRLANNALALSLGGFDIAQIVIAILGVALVAGEYQSGLIRSWFAAAPDRMRVLAAKVGVYGAVTFVVTFVAATLAFLAGQALLPDSFAALSFTSDGVLQALAGTAFYGACIGIMGIGLGFLTRSTAAGTGISVGTLMIGPLLVRLLPASIGDPISKILPSNAGAALSGLDTTTELLSTGWGFAVLCAWVVGVVGAAALTLRRRDA